MPCDHCGTNFTNNIPQECRSYGQEGVYCSDVCKHRAEGEELEA